MPTCQCKPPLPQLLPLCYELPLVSHLPINLALGADLIALFCSLFTFIRFAASPHSNSLAHHISAFSMFSFIVVVPLSSLPLSLKVK
ncbi:hypothetical protein BKA65DRAFT_516442 [Rhexocercosporidium sp. MPI-PUGE-AT-0058]|nr:hypothetical protein BKA65DRAFT_516442 [Rhexocercosporidium sp. MPI-PUGE-AT-0058]